MENDYGAIKLSDAFNKEVLMLICFFLGLAAKVSTG